MAQRSSGKNGLALEDREADASALPRRTAIAMFGVLLGSYVINAMDRQLFPLLVPEVRRQYNFSLSEVGLLSTVFTLGMALAGLPTGYLLSRFSRKTVLQSGIVLFSACTLATVMAFGFSDMLIYRAATGVGEAMQLTILLAIAANYFTTHRAAAVGSVNFSFGIGAIVSPILGGALLSVYKNWQVPIVLFGVLGFVAIAVISLSVRPRFTETQGSAGERIDRGGAATLVNRNTILLTVMSVIGGFVIYGYLGMYPAFLRESLRYSPTTTGTVMSLFGLGALVSIGGGWLGDRFSPRLVLGIAFLVAAVLGYLMFNGSGAVWPQVMLSFGWGIVASGVIYVNLAGYHVKSLRSALAGRASGIFVTSLYGSASVAGYVMGWIATQGGWAAAGTIQLSLLSLVAAVLALALRPDQMSV
jgi:DHA1 family inner membrane transport protein